MVDDINRTEVLEAYSLLLNNLDKVLIRDDIEEMAALFVKHAYEDTPDIFAKFWIFTDLLHAEIGKKVRKDGIPL